MIHETMHLPPAIVQLKNQLEIKLSKGVLKLDFEQLEILIAVSHFQSFRKAAMYLHLSQPTVTYQVHRAEERLGQRLFIRNQSGVELTEAGKQLLMYGSKILNLWKEARDSIREHRELVIGFCPTVAFPSVVNCLTEMDHENPNLSIEVILDDEQRLLKSLEHHQIDLAVVKNIGTSRHLKSKKVFSNKVVLIHKTQSLRTNLMSPQNSFGARIITRASEKEVRMIETKLSSHHISVNTVKTEAKIQIIKSHVIKDWFAILSDQVASIMIREDKLSEIVIPGLFPFYMPVYAVWATDGFERTELKLLVDCLHRAYRQMELSQQGVFQ